MLGLLGAWARGEAYHGAHHLRGAASSLRPVGEGLADLVGNTPLIRLRSLSEETGCEVGWRREGRAWLEWVRHGMCTAALLPATAAPRVPPLAAAMAGAAAPPACGYASAIHKHPQILAKAEFLNPGGSVKDRVALEIIQVRRGLPLRQHGHATTCALASCGAWPMRCAGRRSTGAHSGR